MSFFGGDAHTSVHVEKPDFLTMVAQAPVGSINGCKWCKRTIFWNGANWNHKDDKHSCALPHDMEWTEKRVRIEVDHDFWGRPVYKDGPVAKCRHCNVECDARWLQVLKEWWMPVLLGKCPEKVATPASTPTTPNPQVKDG